MVRWMLREIAEPSGWDPHRLAMEAQLSYHTVRRIWYNEAQQVDLTTLDRLSGVLKGPPGSLIGNGGGGGAVEPDRTPGPLDLLEAHHRFLEEQPEHRLFANAAEVDAYITQERNSWDT
jgi:DNA-binding Xre family transcriptional regulator